MSKEKFLRVGIYIVGLVAIGLSIVIRLDYTLQKEYLLEKDLIYDTDIYGDLYQINMINDFRIQIEPRRRQYQYSEKQPSTEDAEVFFFGDSFLDHSRQTGIPELISDSTGLKVFYDSHYLSPIYMVDMIGIKRDRRRIMIMEVAERYISSIDASPPDPGAKKTEAEATTNKGSVLNQARITYENILGFLFPKNPDKNYEYLLKRGKIVNRIYGFISTIQFRYFGYISDLTPEYSADPPMLFYHETVDSSVHSYFHFHSDEEINSIVENVKSIQSYLRNNYNLEFVLFPVPNKITVYHDLVTQIPYDDFLPRLYSKLEEQNVPVINIYQDFKDSDRMLYYANDTHWNTDGMNLGYNKTIMKLPELGVSIPTRE